MDAPLPAYAKADLFRLIWLVERARRAPERVGRSSSPRREGIRFRQYPHLDHAPADVAALSLPQATDKPAIIENYAAGLIGPNGPLPHHVTEQAIAERLAGGAQPLRDFLDMLGGRFVGLLYRAWTIGVPAYAAQDEGYACAFRTALAAVHGPLPAEAVASGRLHASWFLAYPRSRAYLRHLLEDAFHLKVRIEQFVGAWLALPVHARSRLGGSGATACLGAGVVIGSRSWDRRYRMRIHLRGGSFETYLGFLPRAPSRKRLDALVRGFARSHLEWDVEYELDTADIPPARFGGRALALGLTCWLGKPRAPATRVRLPKAVFNGMPPDAHPMPA